MTKKELRETRRGRSSAAGNAEAELEELERLQKAAKSRTVRLGRLQSDVLLFLQSFAVSFLSILQTARICSDAFEKTIPE